ncbi:HET-domain-containing protein [Zopfia rhizophila CBS 207.26]|uniref:HET-domain-containing protein n=1 Tax=Zopfia rhizophila CBS 207.26 TaxID=1314779 RepID=A0A6A6DQ83_9PEZI|nr:HET-domain-containing protein [Zopfia rhizophila CBS 207.26]
MNDWFKVRLSYSPRNDVTPLGNNTFYISIDWGVQGAGRPLGWALRLNAFADPNDNAADFVTARALQRNVTSIEAQSQICSWIRKCSGHECCLAQRDAILPARIIEVSPTRSPSAPRLLITNGGVGKYATLSYCWGASHSSLISSSNMEEYRHHLDVATLPKTIQDAISVTRAISIPYLWVDALCILQDSDEDKTREIAMMEQIFRDSLVTLVAASSDNASRGFLQLRSGHSTAYRVPFRISPSTFGTMSIQDLDDVIYDETLEPINRRAWTLQEQLLAQRLVIYSSHTLQWRCKAGIHNLGDSLNHSAFDEELYSETLFTLSKRYPESHLSLLQWMKIIHVYTERQASLPNDKLPALAGIVKEFSSELGPCYYAGLWEYCLLWQLMWKTFLPDRYQISKPSQYRAPSWSWASIEGRIWYEHYDDTSQYTPYNCAITHVDTTLKSINSPHGEVKDASLTLRALLRKAWFYPKTKNVLWVKGSDDSADSALDRHLEKFIEEHPEDAHTLDSSHGGAA